MTTLEERPVEDTEDIKPPLFTAQSRGTHARAYGLHVEYAVDNWEEALTSFFFARGCVPSQRIGELLLWLQRALFQSPLVADPTFRIPGVILVVPKSGVSPEELDSEVEILLLKLLGR